MSRNVIASRIESFDYLAPPDRAESDLDAVDRANRAMARLKVTYATEWAPAALADMRAVVAELELDRPARADAFDRIYRLAHDMKGQGATFGYALLTQIGEALCRLTADRDHGSKGEVALLRAHVDGAQRILDERLEGTGGEAGKRLMNRLAALTRRTAH